MRDQRCADIQSQFSPYLDGAVSGHEMQGIAAHLEGCPECSREFAAQRGLQAQLASLGPLKAPADLGMKLRLTISHERARQRSSWLDGFAVKWDNAIRPMLVQVSAGFAGMVAAPEPVMANDEPLGAMTAPHYLYSATTPRAIVTDQDRMIVVEALINSEGQVYDYDIVSGPVDDSVRQQILDQLMLSVFAPSRVFGSPVRGRVVMTFAGISVQG
jgi:anti-sigma factor RsiW